MRQLFGKDKFKKKLSPASLPPKFGIGMRDKVCVCVCVCARADVANDPVQRSLTACKLVLLERVSCRQQNSKFCPHRFCYKHRTKSHPTASIALSCAKLAFDRKTPIPVTVQNGLFISMARIGSAAYIKLDGYRP